MDLEKYRNGGAIYVIIAPLQIKGGYKEQFVAGIMENASGAVHDEPGCLRFDVIQDAGDTNRIGFMRFTRTKRLFKPMPKPHVSAIFGRRAMAGERMEDYKEPVEALLISGRQITSGRNRTWIHGQTLPKKVEYETRRHLADKGTELRPPNWRTKLTPSRAIWACGY